ncbi:MAG: hypothetical protein ACRD0P_15060, partial [Stackebrandtia sp.]
GWVTLFVGYAVVIVLDVDQKRSEVLVEGEKVAASGDGCGDCRFNGDDGEGSGTLVVDADVESGYLEIVR